jgi:gluconate 2-dehydrogenase gamma chain
MKKEKDQALPPDVSPGEDVGPARPRISRRAFVKGIGALAAVSGAAAVNAGCEAPAPSTPAPPPQAPVMLHYPNVPDAPSRPPDGSFLRFFTSEEARAVDALTARIMPSEPDGTGAREAGVIVYIDSVLSQEDGWLQPIYRMPPFAETYEGDEPPDREERIEGYEVIWVQEDELERYGYQSNLSPREVYRMGLAALDRHTRAEYGAGFANLDEDTQDQILEALSEDEIDTFESPAGDAFFDMLWTHTMEGMFADPLYGGNKDLVGWRMLGYPGAQRAYTPQEMSTEGIQREPQSLASMAHFYPGQDAGPHVILPVVGSDQVESEHSSESHP